MLQLIVLVLGLVTILVLEPVLALVLLIILVLVPVLLIMLVLVQVLVTILVLVSVLVPLLVIILALVIVTVLVLVLELPGTVLFLLCWRPCVCANFSRSTKTGLWSRRNLLLPTSNLTCENVKVPRPGIPTPCREETKRKQNKLTRSNKQLLLKARSIHNSYTFHYSVDQVYVLLVNASFRLTWSDNIT